MGFNIRIGKLDKRATLYRKGAVTRDPVYNTEITTWVPFAYENGSPSVARQFWVNYVEEMPSRSEGVLQGLVLAKQRGVLRMRYRAGIDSSMRWTIHYDDGDVVMQIIGGPAILGRKQYLEFMLERITS